MSCCGFEPEEKKEAYTAEIQNEISSDGSFVRQQNIFVTPFGDDEGELKAEAGKYKLYWAKGCHWSNRASIVRELLGLEDAIDVQIVGRGLVNDGKSYAWSIGPEPGEVDPETGYTYLYEFYEAAKPGFEGRATVPTLVDLVTKKAVNNDYHHLTNYFEVAFKPFQKQDAPDLYPEELRDEIDRFNEWLFPNVNNGTYRMMFAHSYAAYKKASDEFWAALDYLEERLEGQRFLFGDYVTDSDVRLFVTLARLETAYYRFLGPIKKGLRGYKNLWAYSRDLYEIPAFRNNTYLRDIAQDYGNAGPTPGNFQPFNEKFWNEVDFDAIWSEPQNRRKLSKTPGQKFLIH